MLTPNDPPVTPDWSLPRGCQCACLCATVGNWRGDERRYCGCCPGSCTTCTHGVVMPLCDLGEN